MRVLHLISGLQQGGAETVLHRLCLASRADMEHVVISFTDLGVLGPTLQAAGITVEHLAIGRDRFTLGGLLLLLAFVWAMFRFRARDWRLPLVRWAVLLVFGYAALFSIAGCQNLGTAVR